MKKSLPWIRLQSYELFPNRQNIQQYFSVKLTNIFGASPRPPQAAAVPSTAYVGSVHSPHRDTPQYIFRESAPYEKANVHEGFKIVLP